MQAAAGKIYSAGPIMSLRLRHQMEAICVRGRRNKALDFQTYELRFGFGKGNRFS